MSQTTRKEILEKLRRRYQNAGAGHKRKLLDQAQELLSYHRKSAVRALGAPKVERAPGIITGRPTRYQPRVLVPWLRPIWQATDYACGRRLEAMLPEWIPAYEAHERRLPGKRCGRSFWRPARERWTGCWSRCGVRGLAVV